MFIEKATKFMEKANFDLDERFLDRKKTLTASRLNTLNPFNYERSLIRLHKNEC